MNKIFEFIRKERLYILLLILVALLNFMLTSASPEKRKSHPQKAKVVEKMSKEGSSSKRQDVEKFFSEHRSLAVIFNLFSLLALLVIFLGLALDVIFLTRRLRGKVLDIRTYHLQTPKWNPWDVAKVVILFLFFGYMAILTELFLVRTFPILKNDDFRMILNTSALDILTVVFILYFAVGQYKEKLILLGISFRNFFKNVFYGIVGYITAIPLLLGLLIITALVTQFLKYTPEQQPVVELFMKQKNTAFLVYTSLFAAVVGPIVEELFFRGFLYTACKKYIGIFPSMLLTAVLFSALHSHPVGFVPIVVLGILLAYLYEKTGTLVSSMTVHIMHNFAMVLIVFLSRSITI